MNYLWFLPHCIDVFFVFFECSCPHKFLQCVIISENPSVYLRNLFTLSVSLNKSKTELIFCGDLSFVVLYFHLHSILWANLLLMNDNEQVDMIYRNLLCQWKMVLHWLVVLDLYSLETVACLFCWVVVMDDEQLESFSVLSFGSWLVVRFLSLKEHCSLNKYLNSVALPVTGSPSLSFGRCSELETKMTRDFFTGSLGVLKYSVSKNKELLDTLYSSINLWVLSGSWFAIKSFTH